jgi:isoamylase
MTTPADARGNLDALIDERFGVERGSPLPFGATLTNRGINFAVFSRHATAVTLVLLRPRDPEPVLELPLDPELNRTGDVWHALVTGLEPGFEYGFRVDGPSTGHHQFDSSLILLDPHAKAVSGLSHWGLRKEGSPRSIIVDDAFDWGPDQSPNTPLADTVIYELHVRGFTRHHSSAVDDPGTYEGVIEKIPYLQSIGITAVELLPVTEFDETCSAARDPRSGEPLLNFWGYHPIAFYAPKASYAASAAPGAQVTAFKRMVRALHAAGIEVILDLVFNHTGEGDVTGPVSSFRGLDNSIYYITAAQSGSYLDYTGCGNSINGNHPVVRDLILDCLRYWVVEMHVDGFRFDLASVLGRGRDGSVLANPPLIERIAEDPILARTKLIAEAWDAAGLYQVGSFPAWGRWGEWNGRYRDDVRAFLRGEAGLAGTMATRISGSPDLYRHYGGGAHHAINFVTCHDGFTLRDLVTYDHKHNHANGEASRDGTNDNRSWNCGWEGPDAPITVEALRDRQVRNAMVLLLLSQGVPMLMAGDERSRTQRGNNNAYCQDSDVSWLDWWLPDRGLAKFVADVIAFRRAHPQLRDGRFFDPRLDGSPAITWHGRTPHQPDWSAASHLVAFMLPDRAEARAIYAAFNVHAAAVDVMPPAPPHGTEWRLAIDTSDRTCHVELGGLGRCIGGEYRINGRTSIVLEAWSDQ